MRTRLTVNSDSGIEAAQSCYPAGTNGPRLSRVMGYARFNKNVPAPKASRAAQSRSMHQVCALPREPRDPTVRHPSFARGEHPSRDRERARNRRPRAISASGLRGEDEKLGKRLRRRSCARARTMERLSQPRLFRIAGTVTPGNRSTPRCRGKCARWRESLCCTGRLAGGRLNR